MTYMYPIISVGSSRPYLKMSANPTGNAYIEPRVGLCYRSAPASFIDEIMVEEVEH